MKNGTATGNDHININTLKAGEDTISKTLAKLYTKCLSERQIPTAWKNAKMMLIIFKKGNKKVLKNYRLICLLSNVYKVLRKVLMKRLEKTGDRRCGHRTHEGNLHQQLDDSSPSQRKQKDQHQKRGTTGKYHIAEAVHGSTRKYIPTTDLGNQRLEDRRRTS